MHPAARFGRAAIVAILSACAAWADDGPNPPRLRPGDLVESAESHFGRTVVVDIVESLSGPSSPEALARLEYGQVRVNVPDARGGELSLVPEGFRLADPDRYKRKFDRVLASPVRVRGELLEDVELSRPGRRALVLRVLAIEPLALPPPIRVGSVEEILADRKRFDRSVVEIEGDYESRFEISRLSGKIWLSTYPDAEIVRPPANRQGRHRVRAVGVLFAREGAHYGHLGAYPLLLVAQRIEYR